MNTHRFEARCILSIGATLVVCLASGCGDGPTTPSAPPPAPPVAGMSAEACFTTSPSPAVIDVSQSVELDAGCSKSDASPDALTFQWDLGDGRVVSGPSVEASYPRPGTYRVRLTLGSGGQTSTTDAQVVVRPNPEACFVYQHVLDEDGKEMPCTIAFDASCSVGDVGEYRWFFERSALPPDPPPDQNATTTEPTIVYSWAEDWECLSFRPFQKTVRLTVVDDRGVDDMKEVRISFREPK